MRGSATSAVISCSYTCMVALYVECLILTSILVSYEPDVCAQTNTASKTIMLQPLAQPWMHCLCGVVDSPLPALFIPLIALDIFHPYFLFFTLYTNSKRVKYWADHKLKFKTFSYFHKEEMEEAE